MSVRRVYSQLHSFAALIQRLVNIRSLATGSANGRIAELFAGITKINAKYGPFDMLLCVGDLFGEADESVVNAVLSGSIHGMLRSLLIASE